MARLRLLSEWRSRWTAACAAADGEVDDLGDLAAGGVIAGPEGVVAVAAEDAVADCRLDVLVERAAGRHIREGGGGRVEQRPAVRALRGDHDDLGKLAARDEVAT